MFDFIEYMRGIHGKLKATKTNYEFARVSGIDHLEEVLENTRRKQKYFAVDDSQDGVTFRGAGGSFFERRLYTVFLLVQAEPGNMTAREQFLTEVRAIFRNILSKAIVDKMTIPVIDLDRVAFYEVAPNFANGCVGIYFTFTVQNPVDLRYDATAWNS